VLSAERLLGVAHERTRFDFPDATPYEFRQTSLFLVGTTPRVLSIFVVTRIVPRLGFDLFPLEKLSVGASVAVWRNASELWEEGEKVDDVSPVEWGVVAGPRLGYALGLGGRVALWPRVGVSFLRSRLSDYGEGYYPDNDGSTTRYTFRTTAVTLEGLVAWSPAPHMAIFFGPFADLGTSGKGIITVSNSNDVDDDTTIAMKTFGITIGLGATAP